MSGVFCINFVKSNQKNEPIFGSVSKMSSPHLLGFRFRFNAELL